MTDGWQPGDRIDRYELVRPLGGREIPLPTDCVARTLLDADCPPNRGDMNVSGYRFMLRTE